MSEVEKKVSRPTPYRGAGWLQLRCLQRGKNGSGLSVHDGDNSKNKIVILLS